MTRPIATSKPVISWAFAASMHPKAPQTPMQCCPTGVRQEVGPPGRGMPLPGARRGDGPERGLGVHSREDGERVPWPTWPRAGCRWRPSPGCRGPQQGEPAGVARAGGAGRARRAGARGEGALRARQARPLPRGDEARGRVPRARGHAPRRRRPPARRLVGGRRRVVAARGRRGW